MAARSNGPAAADVVRVQERIERLQKTIDALQNSRGTLGLPPLPAACRAQAHRPIKKPLVSQG